MTRQEEFLSAYIEAIYFTETGDTGQPSALAELTPYFKAVAWSECRNFWRAYGALICEAQVTPDQAGHDLWLTRNGHGVGFWDRPEIYGEDLAQELTRAAQAVGSRDAEFTCQCFSRDEIEVMVRSKLVDYLDAWDLNPLDRRGRSTDELREEALAVFEKGMV